MPKKIIIAQDAAPAGGPYSHAVVAGDHVYLAGACPVLPDGTWVRGAFADQVLTSSPVTRVAGAVARPGELLLRAIRRRPSA